MQAPLKLIALDEEDLGIVSFHLYQAQIRVKDIVRQAAAGRFLLALQRRARQEGRESAGKAAAGKQKAAIPAILHFERVTAVRSFGIDRRQGDALLTLQGLYFHAAAKPSGTIELLFAEKAGLQCVVECIEARLEDAPA